MNSLTLSIFLPTFNEEKNIEKTLRDILSFVENSQRISNYELLVINDGSTDATKSMVEKISQENPRIKLISHTTNQGYGAAVRTGIRNSQHEYIFFTDADGQFNISNLNNFFAYIPEYEAVIGYRENRKDTLQRKIKASVWGILVRIFFKLKVHDIDCAFKLVKREVFKNMHMNSNGNMISAELLIQMYAQRVKITELPVEHLPRVHGVSKGANVSVILRALKEIYLMYHYEKNHTK